MRLQRVGGAVEADAHTNVVDVAILAAVLDDYGNPTALLFSGFGLVNVGKFEAFDLAEHHGSRFALEGRNRLHASRGGQEREFDFDGGAVTFDGNLQRAF